MTTTHEKNLIASVLNGANPLNVTGINHRSFYDQRDGDIWQAMVQLAGQRVTPDQASITSQLGKQADPEHLATLVDKTINPANTEYHAKKVAEAHSRRQLVDIAYRIQAGADSDRPYNDVIEEARKLLDEAVTVRQTTRTLAEIYPTLVENIRSGVQTGYSTPWADLDRFIVGFQPGRLYTLAARPGVGKTIAAQDIATHMSKRHNKRVYFSTLEMSDEELGLRFLSSASGIDSKKLQTGRLTPEQWAKIDREGERGFIDLKIDICSTPSQTIETIRSGARDTARKGDLGMIIVDYLQLMEGAKGKQDRNRAEVVSEFSRGLKNMAQEFHIPVLALSQLNRSAADQKPTLANLRESGSIEQDSDVVMLLHDVPESHDSEVNLIVAKARNGSLGTVELVKYGYYSSLREPHTQHPYTQHWYD
ncbi:DnaB-like helicase C-terminal domain-containing protein [Auritidibacter ignavus]|uniref:DNA 5'-3' helicase n=1 Tax=Auritidibacter ignavus TaxID=678932 RepID=A0AAJ6ALQ0_9MICC|nr:DnaB-like helicase C-terminal domain-containing protein [Auritidibacter ignavus]WGH91434.1 DnaB-like helicase C-terminal domain-containing protein [Auritidibacter ignavus]WGH92109.1 DnaB-like helicase C-terminal domain-containing protein [Auritidibacter ignavus]